MENLNKLFNPENIAVIGASDKSGTVGYGIMKNLSLNFKGKVFPVNPNHERIQEKKSYSSVMKINENIDLAVVAVPAKITPKVIEECGKKGVKACVVVSSGFKEIGKEGKRLENKIRNIIDKYDIRLVGPNCLGIINTKNKLNASFSSRMPKRGTAVVLSQSGALGSAIIEWSLEQKVGVDTFVSVGSMLDIDFSDLIEYFGEKEDVTGIIIYMESIKEPKRFMKIARQVVKKKPIIVLKAGQTESGRKAAVSHTGSIAGNKEVYKAAFRQNGILQINGIEDVFNFLRTLNNYNLPDGPNLGIVTNAGGAGVMAVDAVENRNGNVAKLSKKTIKRLNKVLPSAWSRQNPIDVLGDASPEIYRSAMRACLEDENVDGVLVIFTPQYTSDPEDTAKVVSEMRKKYDKPVFSSWVGPKGMDEASKILNKNSVSNYPAPEDAVEAFVNMLEYKNDLKLLKDVKKGSPIKNSVKEKINSIINKSGRVLSEVDSKKILSFYNIPVVDTRFAQSARKAAKISEEMGFPVVMKVVSPDITHKTDADAVIPYLHTKKEVKDAFNEIVNNCEKYDKNADIKGVSVQNMVDNIDYELILGSKKDPDFGPVVLFGHGGVDVEVYGDTAIGIPPLNKDTARRVMENTKVFRFLKDGHRNKNPVKVKELEKIIRNFSYLILDFPEIDQIDINPLAISDKKPVSLDARIVLDKK